MKGWNGRAATKLTGLCLDEYGTVCHLCGMPGADTADHLIPRSRGGPDALDNLRPAHKRCNSRRQAMPLAQWFAQQRGGGGGVPPAGVEDAKPSRQW